jgi:hypothetical protein
MHCKQKGYSALLAQSRVRRATLAATYTRSVTAFLRTCRGLLPRGNFSAEYPTRTLVAR